MEKGDNVALAKKYEVRAYPTYLFLDSDGKLVHKGLGSMPAAQFVEVAKVAADTENNYAALSKKIKSGDRSYATIKKFLDQNPYDSGNGALVDSYFQTLSENQIYTQENWDMFNNYVNDISSESFRFFIENREKIAEFIGKDKTDQKITNALSAAYNQYPAKEDELKKIDSQLFAAAKSKVDFAKAYRNYNQAKDDKAVWDNLWKVATPYLNLSTNPAELNNMAWMIYENYKKFKDTKMLKTALSWAEKAHLTAPDKDFIADTYAHLLYENGKKKEAVKIETKALEMAAKAGNTEAAENYKKTIEKFKK